MPDVLYDIVQAFVDFMDHMTPLDMLVVLFVGFLAPSCLVLLHELGHALAALAVGRRVVELSVGDGEPILVVQGNGFRFSFALLLGRGDVGGFVVHGGEPIAARDVIVIALAGPAGSLVGALAATWAAGVTWPHHHEVAVWLGLTAVTGFGHAVANLVPAGDGPDTWTDGAWVRAARRTQRELPPSRTPHRDPREASSVPPPGYGAKAPAAEQP